MGAQMQKALRESGIVEDAGILPNLQGKTIGIIVDIPNIYISTKNYKNAKLGYDAFLNVVKKGFILHKAVACTLDNKNSGSFFKSLKCSGYEVVAIPWYKHLNESKTENETVKKTPTILVDFTVECFKLAEKAEVLVLVTCNKAFLPIIKELKSRGKTVIIIGYQKCTSGEVQREASFFMDVETDSHFTNVFIPLEKQEG